VVPGAHRRVPAERGCGLSDLAVLTEGGTVHTVASPLAGQQGRAGGDGFGAQGPVPGDPYARGPGGAPAGGNGDRQRYRLAGRPGPVTAGGSRLRRLLLASRLPAGGLLASGLLAHRTWWLLAGMLLAGMLLAGMLLAGRLLAGRLLAGRLLA